MVVLYELLKESGYKIPAKSYWEFAEKMLMSKENVTDLDSYLHILHAIDDIQSFPLAIERSVYNSFVSSYLAGCDYLELRFNPTKRSQNGKIDLDTIIISARAGMEKAKNTFGIKGGLILCMGRDCTPEANKAVFDKAVKYHNKGVKGIDIAGPYIDRQPIVADFYMAHRFPDMYLEAEERGMMTTVHAGETEHPNLRQEMEFIIRCLQPKRIGHGVQIFKFPDLVDFARSKGMMFEFCPTSNLTTGVIKDKKELYEVIENFHKNQLLHTVCTDATYLLQTDIKQEYDLYFEVLGEIVQHKGDVAKGWGLCVPELDT